MSIHEYHRKLGRTSFTVNRAVSAASTSATITLKTPISGARLAMTGVAVGANLNGTVAFYFGGDHDNDTPILVLNVPASSTVSPNLHGFEATAVGAPIELMVSSGAVDAFNVTIEGFELYDN